MQRMGAIYRTRHCTGADGFAHHPGDRAAVARPCRCRAGTPARRFRLRAMVPGLDKRERRKFLSAFGGL